jgi:hypothetical protein
VIEQQFGIEILPIWHDKPGDAEGFTRDIRSELAKLRTSHGCGSMTFAIAHATQLLLAAVHPKLAQESGLGIRR